MSDARGRPPRRGGGGGRGGGRGGGNRGGHNHSNGSSQAPSPQHQDKSQQPSNKKQIEERQQALKKEQAETATKSAEALTELELTKPLEKANRYVKNELNESRPVKALGPTWLQSRPPLPEFHPEDNPREGQTLLEETRADPFYSLWSGALSALLIAPYHVFWSTIVHDEFLRRFLDTFLRFFVRPGESAFALVLKSASRKQVFEDVFRVYWRAGQRTEPRPNGPELYMEQAFYNKLIAENLFDVPRILDLVALYGRLCPDQVRALINTACNSDPRTIENLFESGVLLTEGLEKMETRVKREKEVEDLQDAHNYILDVCHTLSRFVALYPPAAAPIARSGLIARLAHVFERVLPPLCVALGPTSRRKDLEKGIAKLAFTLLNGCYLGPLSSPSAQVQRKHLNEELTNVLVATANVPAAEGVQNNANFIDLVDSTYQLRSRIAALPTADSDPARRKYLLATLDDRCASRPRGSLPAASPASAPAAKAPATSAPAAAAPKAAGKVPPKAVAQVQELFPHLSADFITRCLAAFDNSADRTINALLENNLPPGLDANAPSASAAAPTTASTLGAALAPQAVPPPAERRNVYDTQQPAEIRLGKKEKHAEDSESARKDREHLKEFVRNYEWTYDDEADDSLDAFGVGVSDRTADEALAASKARSARVGAKKGEEEEDEGDENAEGEGEQGDDEDGEEGESEEEEEQTQSGKKPAAAPTTPGGKPAPKPELSARGRRNKERKGASGHRRKEGAARKMARALPRP